jgi:hypothetical protein
MLLTELVAKNTNIKMSAPRYLLTCRHNHSMTLWEGGNTIKVPGYHTNLSKSKTDLQNC